MADLIVSPAAKPLRGSVPVPSDKSIAHRALLLSALGRGRSRIVTSAMGEDNVRTAAALRAMGVEIDLDPSEIRVVGVGLRGLRAPADPIDCGNSGTTMRLLAGLCAAQPFVTTLIGDASLSRRPMERVARPLRLRGATIEGALDPKRPGECTAPLRVGPLAAPFRLTAFEHAMQVPSAQVKSALLLSGLYASGPTIVHEPTVSRDHTERMLSALGVNVGSMGAIVHLDPGDAEPAWDGFEAQLPGDASAAAFLIAGAAIVPSSRVDVRDVGTNPTRTGFFEILRDMGGAFEIEGRGATLGEPIGLVRAAFSELSAARIGGEIAARAIDELPIACALAARARGTTTISDAAELRVKESDRIAAMADVLGAFGIACETRPDGLSIEGRPEGRLRACDVASRGDHRIAMTAAILALVADGPCRVRDADPIRTSFPKFVGTLRALGATVEVRQEDRAA